ncbi:hypothetical protein E3E31_12170 [Thermococcus sp. M39]|uniref:hypothetical protein n=1 Tax=Thermococcus sp. M39 TaxID=1638262 RepID=UPI00143BDEA1|nr:hypothetical protein [Thermococcus sp. M39]NJE09264.1 hypothetical protein [Thermococcus sp. M39]
MNYILDFRTLLLFLATLYKDSEFDSVTVSKDLLTILTSKDEKIIKRFSSKQISNDLRRLYMMGFLRRRKVKRECRTKSGETCYRGYKYMYQINNQGWRYILHLIGPKDEFEEILKKSREGAIIKKLMDEIYESDLEKELAWELYKSKHLKRKGYRRFPQKYKIIEKIIEASVELAEKEKEIERLRQELKEKDKIIEELKNQLEECTKLLKIVHHSHR